jgi:acetylcholinesterase
MKPNILIAIVCLANLWTFGQSDPHIEISSGKIKGSYLSSSSGRNFLAFRGVPYAKPPTGELRLRVKFSLIEISIK